MAGVLGWMALAIYFDFASPGPPWVRAALGALVPVGAVIALLLRWVLTGTLGCS